MSSKLPVLVVGAGPSGLTAALCLARHGVPVRIIDSSAEFHKGTRGAGLQPRSLEVFKILGLLDQVNAERGIINPPAHFYKYPETSEVERVDKNPLLPPLDPTPDRPLGSMWYVPQNRLEAVFRKDLEKYGVKVELNHELVNFEQTPSNVIATIRVKSTGAEEKEEKFEAAYLIGADGAKGPVRKILKLDFLGKTMDADGMLVGNMAVDNLSTEASHVWRIPKGLFFSLRPISHDPPKFSMAVLGPGAILEGQDNPEAMRELFAKYTERKDVTIGDFDWFSFFKPNMRVVNKFSEGQVFVVGDAAHVHSPHGGQGLNTSVQDSFNLGWKMALVWHGRSPATLLNSYNEERLPVVAEMLRKVVGMYNQFTEDVDKALSAAAHPKELFQLDINYRWSSILAEGRHPSTASEEELKAHAYLGWDKNICAGDRAPDAPGLVVGGKTTTLHETLNPTMHTILIFGDSSPFSNLDGIIRSKSLANSMQTFLVTKDAPSGGSDITGIHDRDGLAHTAYLVASGQPTAVIIRPDGYIGAIGTSGETLDKYFDIVCS